MSHNITTYLSIFAKELLQVGSAERRRQAADPQAVVTTCKSSLLTKTNTTAES